VRRNSLALAFGLLTALPVPGLPAVDRRSAGAAILLAPVTVLPVLAGLAAGHAAAAAGLPPLVAAGLVVAAAALLTRAMHLDGLADTADGLSAGHDAARSLRAMKSSDIGPSGVAALVLALLLQVASLAALIGSPGGATLAALAWLASRQFLAWACRWSVPAAQPEGLGALVAGAVGRAALVGSTALLAVAALAVGAVPGTPWWAGAVVAVSGLATAGWLLRRCRSRLGGITGDVLGACVETALTGALLAGAAVVGLTGPPA
jgi:adenosylcobinamide-GDP ribazoletransferase